MLNKINKIAAKKLGIAGVAFGMALFLAVSGSTLRAAAADTAEETPQDDIATDVGNYAEDEDAVPNDVIAPAPIAPAPSDTWEIEKKTYSHTYKTKKGLVYKTVSYEYPVAAGNGEAAKEFNAFYTKQLKEWKKYQKLNLADAKDDVKGLADAGDERYYSDKVTCEITQEDGGYISVLQTGYEYTLGAHGMPYRVPAIFDVSTGKQVAAKDILSMSKKQVNAAVRKLYLEQYDALKGTDEYPFYEMKRSRLNKDLKKIDFNAQCYLKDGALYFYTDPYAVGPYAAGFIEVSIAL